MQVPTCPPPGFLGSRVKQFSHLSEVVTGYGVMLSEMATGYGVVPSEETAVYGVMPSVGDSCLRGNALYNMMFMCVDGRSPSRIVKRVSNPYCEMSKSSLYDARCRLIFSM